MTQDTSCLPDVGTQNKKLYAYLMNGGSITTLEAMTKLHIGCLTKRISDLLHNYGVPIHKEKVPNSSGRGKYGRYTIIEQNRVKLNGISLECVERTHGLIFQRGSEPRGIYNSNYVFSFEDELGGKKEAINNL